MAKGVLLEHRSIKERVERRNKRPGSGGEGESSGDSNEPNGTG
jgi:hypothetical protein